MIRHIGGIVNYRHERKLGDRVWKLLELDSHLRLLKNILSFMIMMGILIKDKDKDKVMVKGDHVDLCRIVLPPKGLMCEFQTWTVALGDKADDSQHPPYYAQEPGPSSLPLPPIPRFPMSGPNTEWTSQRPSRPSVEVNPRPRLSMTNPTPPMHNGPWFTIDETPQRNQVGWSQGQIDIYNAGWGDALRAVEAGTMGIGGQQCTLSCFCHIVI